MTPWWRVLRDWRHLLWQRGGSAQCPATNTPCVGNRKLLWEFSWGGGEVSVMLVFTVCSSETGTYHGSSVLYWKGCKIPEWHTEVGVLYHAHIKLGCFSSGLDKCHNEYLFIVGSEAKVIMREHLLLSKLNETESLPIKLNTETHSTFYLPKHLSELPQKLQKERFKSNSHFAMKAASWRVCLLWKTWNEMLVKNYVEAKAAMHSECQQRQCESWSLCQGRLAMGLIPLVLGPSSGKGGGGEWRRTMFNSMEHSKAAAKGDSSSNRLRQWSCWEIWNGTKIRRTMKNIRKKRTKAPFLLCNEFPDNILKDQMYLLFIKLK